MQYVSISYCAIWGRDFTAQGHEFMGSRDQSVHESGRTGGRYHITGEAAYAAERLSAQEKARLTTWLVDQRFSDEDMPRITKEIVNHAVARRPLPTYARAMRLLKFLARHTGIVSDQVDLTAKTPRPEVHLVGEFGLAGKGIGRDVYNSPHLKAMAWTESTHSTEVFYLADYLENEGLVVRNQVRSNLDGPVHSYQVTVAGHQKIEELETIVNGSQASVAMWFDDSLKEAYEHGIAPAVERAGYRPLRIDRKDHINKIDDEIIAEIRRSRFLVADFTQGDIGARGGVYYEAGFAKGLNLPVIFTCQEASVDSLHFDTNHYNHLVWTTPEELRDKLKNRILANIGPGPEAYEQP